MTNQPQLKLIWVNKVHVVAQKNRDNKQKEATSDPPPTLASRWWNRLKNNAPAILVLLAFATIIWNTATTYTRLGNLEEALNGKDGLKEQVKGLSGSVTNINVTVAKLDTKIHAIEKVVLRLFEPSAKKLLGTPNVAIFHSNFLPASASVPYEPVVPVKDQKVLILTYTIEGIRDNFVLVRSQLEHSDGKVVKTVRHDVIKMRLPTKVGEPVTYGLRLKSDDGKIIFPTVEFRFVVLERLSPTELILATGVKSQKTS